MDMILGADTAAIFWIQNHLVHPWLTPWMIGASSLGDLHGLGIIWCLLAGVLIYTRKYRRVGIAVILALLFCLVVGDLALKNLIMRARPASHIHSLPCSRTAVQRITPSRRGIPSAHLQWRRRLPAACGAASARYSLRSLRSSGSHGCISSSITRPTSSPAPRSASSSVSPRGGLPSASCGTSRPR